MIDIAQATESDATIVEVDSSPPAESESEPNWWFIAIATPIAIALIVGIACTMLWFSFKLIFGALAPNPESELS